MQKKVVLSKPIMPNQAIVTSSVQFLRTSSEDDILSFEFLKMLSEHKLFALNELPLGHILKPSDCKIQ